MADKHRDGVMRFRGGHLEVDAPRRVLLRDGQPVELGGRAWTLLVALLERRGQVCSREVLLQAVWPGRVVSENNLHVQVGALRQVFGPEAIRNLHGQGYLWTLEPEQPPALQLLGRTELLRELVALVDARRQRLITFTGLGGVGKTRLAQALFERVRRSFDGGAWTVSMAALHDPALAADAVAATLGLHPQGPQGALPMLQRWLAEREGLLLLDNLEQLRGIGTSLVLPLLQAAPGLTVLATSRVPLKLPLEHLCEVPELAVAGDDPPALRLLVQRAAEAGVQLPVGLGESLQEPALRLCRRLQGLPLALELVAPRLRLMPLPVLEAELARSLALVGAGDDAPPHRHRSLRDLFDWSLGLLSPGSRELLRRLAVFAGGFDLVAAEAVAVDDPSAAARATLADRLDELVDQRLLQRVVQSDLEGSHGLRFVMHEMVREQALSELGPARQQALAERHARHFSDWAEAMDAAMQGPQRRTAQARVAADRDNLRVALAHRVRVRRDTLAALRLVGALSWVWYFDAAWVEGRRWQDEALALPPPESVDEATLASYRLHRAAVLSGASKLLLYLGDPPGAAAYATQAVEALQALPPQGARDQHLGWALFHRAIASIARDRAQATAGFDEAGAIFDRRNLRWAAAIAQVYSGIPASLDPTRQADAHRRLTEGRERLLALGDAWGWSTADHYLGLMALRRGDVESAARHHVDVERVARDMDDRYRLANARHQAARLELARGRQREALRCLFESASMFTAQGGLGQASLVLQQAARLVFKLGDPRAAARLLAAASVERGPAVIQMFMPDELAAVEGLRAQLNEQLGEAAQARLAEEGRRWTLAQALASVQACLAAAVPAA